MAQPHRLAPLQDRSSRPDLPKVQTISNIEPPPVFYRTTRYGDAPTDWRTRLAGAGGTAAIFAGVLAALFVTWHTVQPMITPALPLAVTIMPPAAPPEPVQEVPDGPQQTEQQEQIPQEKQERPDPSAIVLQRIAPTLIPPPPPAPPVAAAEPMPETTAPQSQPAPPASRAASDAEASWEAQLLAHLEQHRRYPAAARARRAEGVAHVQFRMNRQGQVLSAEIQRSAGSAALDRAALETLRRAQPLPAIPDDRPDPLQLTVPVEFFVSR